MMPRTIMTIPSGTTETRSDDTRFEGSAASQVAEASDPANVGESSFSMDEMIVSLNRVLTLLGRSAARYAVQTSPWVGTADHALWKAVADLAADQEHYIRILSEKIIDRGGRPDLGCFPLEWTGLNDTSIRFLAPWVLQRHQDDLSVLKSVAERAHADDPFRSLLTEIIGNAEAHREVLRTALETSAARPSLQITK